MTLTVRGAVYIVKDLVPDLTQFYKQYKSIEPYLQNDNVPEREHLQSQEDRRKVRELPEPSHYNVFHFRFFCLFLLSNFFYHTIIVVKYHFFTYPDPPFRFPSPKPNLSSA